MMNANPLHVLLVEDEAAHVRLIGRAFEDAGADFELTVAATLKQARSEIDTSAADVVIADLMLPDGRGTNLLPSPQNGADYPVIVLTSQGNEQMAVEAMKAGALDYVVKSPAVLNDMPRIASAASREWQHLLQRRRAEGEREQTLKLLEGVLDSLSAQVAVLDDSATILMTNAAWRDSTDESPFCGPDFAAQCDYLRAAVMIEEDYPEISQQITTGIREVLDSEKPRFSIEFPWLRHKRQRWCQLNVTPFTGAGAARVVVFFEDITERKLAEEEARARAVSQARFANLSPREREVMELVVAGNANKVIARTIHRSEKTVEKHRANVMRKLEVRSVAELVRLAVAGGADQ